MIATKTTFARPAPALAAMAAEPVQEVAEPSGRPVWGKLLVGATVVSAACLVPRGTSSAASAGQDVADLAAGTFGRRLSTSTTCRQKLDAMLTNEHWSFMNNSYTKWCRIKAENEMARCCGVADFAQGRGEDCGTTRMSGTAQPTECRSDCWHNGMADFCSANFGRACRVDRTIFDGVILHVDETFCVPQACDNSNDRESLMNWYATLYAERLSGWHKRWDQAILNCPSTAVGALLYTLLALVCVPILLVVAYILFVAPKGAGRLLKSQEEMQKEAAQADGRHGGEGMGDLRGTAQFMDALGQSSNFGVSGSHGMSRTR